MKEAFEPDVAGDPTRGTAAILRPGENCWRLARSERMAFLVDGDAYYRALHEALLAAREQVLILGWDVDGRLELVRGEDEPRAPSALRDLLNFLVERRPGLDVHVLLWDFAFLYALEREPFPSINLGLRTAPAINVKLDDTAPIGGSRHEKIVVIDDRLAFCGGLDLTDARWDTPAHALEDEFRVRSDGTPYEPFHDVQAVVDGEAAKLLGVHCRERWEHVTGERLTTPRSRYDPWPKGLNADVSDVEVAIARTREATDDVGAVREVERLYIDAIEAACDYVYIENQYLTSDAVADAIASRLREEDGPEFVLVSPDSCSGWLEENVMGALRKDFVSRLRSSDRFERLGIYCPLLDENSRTCLMVHAKLFISDDRFARIGSSNLTNRSLGLDSECDLAIEAGDGDDHVCDAIRELRNRLLGEHLGVDPSQVQARIEARGSLLGAIDDFRDNPRRLVPCEIDIEDVQRPTAIAAALGDPSRPLEASETIEEFRDKITTELSGYSGVLGLAALAALVVGLALVWQYTDLADFVSIEETRSWMGRLRSSGVLSPLILLVVYLIGGLVAFPVMVLNAATAIAFGPWLGFAYAVAGSLASAIVTFAIGKRIGSGAIRRFSSGIVYQASRAISDRGFLAVLSCRLVPVAPFTVVNLVAGAIPVRFIDYVAGTLIGMVPGIAVLAAFGFQIEQVLESPSLANVVLLAAVVVVWIGLGFVFNRLLRKVRPGAR